MRKIKNKALIFLLALLNIPGLFLMALVSRSWKLFAKRTQYNVFWGTEPIINFYHWARATGEIFTNSVFITRYDSYVVNGRAHLTLFSSNRTSGPFPQFAKTLIENFIFFVTLSRVLFSANLVCMSCDGFIFQHYKILGFNYRIELYLLKLAGIKICVLPYGGDAYVYSRVRDKNWLFGLISDYPFAAKQQIPISKRVDFYIRESDIFLPGQMLFDGLGRSDWITPSTLCVQEPDRVRARKTSDDKLIVTHAPNHRAVKGTRFVIEAVDGLVKQGYKIELKLLERKTNEEVIRTLLEESDLHVDQLIFDGYGLNALESMSLGIPTVGNFSGPCRNFFDRWSHTEECPMIIANEETLMEVLLRIIENKSVLEPISRESIDYVKKYHSYKSFARNFSRILLNVDPIYAQWSHQSKN